MRRFFTEIKEILQEAWRLLKMNWKVVFPFLFLYSIFNIPATWVITSVYLESAMRIYGTTYIGPDNIVRFFETPVTAVFELFSFITLSLLQIVEIAAVMYAFSRASVGKKTSFRNMKELDPTIITTYSMYVAWENIEDIPFADYYTVEENNVDETLVDHVHSKGGKIFAWTVNSEDTVQYLVDCGVDGILTDNPNMMRNALNAADYRTGFPKLLRMYLDLLKNY